VSPSAGTAANSSSNSGANNSTKGDVMKRVRYGDFIRLWASSAYTHKVSAYTPNLIYFEYCIALYKSYASLAVVRFAAIAMAMHDCELCCSCDSARLCAFSDAYRHSAVLSAWYSLSHCSLVLIPRLRMFLQS
jgi:hypothetical protein